MLFYLFVCYFLRFEDVRYLIELEDGTYTGCSGEFFYSSWIAEVVES